MNNYNTHLSELRNQKHLSLKEASKQIGISRFSLYLYENGYFRPSKKATKLIEEFYQEKLPFEGEDAYPAPTKEKTIPVEKKSAFAKKLVFGILSGAMLLSIITGVVLFNKSVNNTGSYYGETYNELRDKVNETGDLGHDIVTSLPYHYIAKENTAAIGNILFYETDNILYFNECTYSTTFLTTEYGMVRYHYQFGSNLGINSNYCEFNFGSWSKGIYFSCNFLYKGGPIDEIENLTFAVDTGAVNIDEETAINIINQNIANVENHFSNMMSETLGRDVSFYDDFLPDREKGRKINFSLQITALFLIIPGIIAFFIFFAIFLRLMIQNIKPRLVTTEPESNANKREPLPNDWRINFGIPDIFIIVLSKVLQFGSILMLLFSLLSKVGLHLPAFFNDPNFLAVHGIFLLAGIFLEHFVMIGRIKKATTLFRAIIYNLFIFLFIATMETVLIAITNAWGYDFAGLVYKYVPGNVYQVVAVHYLIFLFLFFQPSFTKKKWVRTVWHCLSLLPLGFLIATYFFSNSYALTYGVKENIYINFWFPNGFLLLSIVCVLFMYITFGVRLYYEKKYGQHNAQYFFYGDRYTFYENLICSILIVLAGSLDFIFMHNQYAYYLGLGSNYWILAMIPFIILCKYTPNNQQIFLISEQSGLSRSHSKQKTS